MRSELHDEESISSMHEALSSVFRKTKDNDKKKSVRNFENVQFFGGKVVLSGEKDDDSFYNQIKGHSGMHMAP